MKRGFTLIELLGVIILLALLILLIFPAIINFIKSSNDEIDDMNIELIYNAVDMYIENNSDKFIKKDGNSYCVTLKELVELEYLSSSIKLSNNIHITDAKSVQITYQGKHNYKLVDKNNCIEKKVICKSVTSETKTTGNIPSGNYSNGDEYICEVKPNIEYHFFVISKDDNNVNLILDRNIHSSGNLTDTSYVSNVAWLSTLDGSSVNDGPITAFNFLHKATSDWISIPNITINHIYTDVENTGFKTIDDTVSIINEGTITATYKNFKARLPYTNEITDSKCTDTLGSCPLWLTNYMTSSSYAASGGTNITGIQAYWGIPTESTIVPIVNFDGNYKESAFYGGITNAMLIGVRPVISIPKVNIF